MDMVSTDTDENLPPVRELSRSQRRVLGVLIEKGMTTPDQYPLTLKAATAGCNQKSNREPVTNYSEDDVLRVLDELREMGLVAVVLPSTGRTERYRHFVRKRFTFSEPQIAILAELWLRGRQQLGELRSRASRMVAIDSLDDLRQELQRLLDAGYLQSSGSLERRGIEVDHNFYRATEGQKLEQTSGDEPEPPEMPLSATSATAAVSHPAGEGASSVEVQQLRVRQEELEFEVEQLREQLSDLSTTVETLKRELGV